jgi:hypothetical protein
MPTPTYTPLATITLSSTTTQVTFSSIPSTYRDLIVVVAGTTTSTVGIGMLFNNDGGANYSYVDMYGSGGGTPSSSSNGADGNINVGVMSTGQSNIIWQVMDYSATDKHKAVLVRTNVPDGWGVRAAAGRWANTAAINSVRILRNGVHSINSGTVISLYGIAA